jgi:hypothetical protein
LDFHGVFRGFRIESWKDPPDNPGEARSDVLDDPNDAHVAARFRSQYQALASLDHSTMAHVEAFQFEGRTYLAIEHLDGSRQTEIVAHIVQAGESCALVGWRV